MAGRQGVKRANTLKLLPSRLASRAYGAVNRMPLPVPLRAVAYSSWAWAFKAKLHEAGLPLASYPSLNAFFTRKLKPGLRPVDGDAALVSPVDGIVVSSSSDLKRDGILKQVKAIDFRPEDFLGLAAPPEVRIPGNVLHSAVICAYTGLRGCCSCCWAALALHELVPAVILFSQCNAAISSSLLCFPPRLQTCRPGTTTASTAPPSGRSPRARTSRASACRSTPSSSTCCRRCSAPTSAWC